MTATAAGAPRVVLDTNVVLDLLHFGDAGCAALAGAIGRGAVQAVTSGVCLEELRCVLAYPVFALDGDARQRLLSRYAQSALMIEVPAMHDAVLPRCSDGDDQKFLELAWHAKASLLISKDKALLRMARRFARAGGCAIVLPAQFGMHDD